MSAALRLRSESLQAAQHYLGVEHCCWSQGQPLDLLADLGRDLFTGAQIILVPIVIMDVCVCLRSNISPMFNQVNVPECEIV